MGGNNPLVSVIIPAYNHEKYVQETIHSIINQTYKNIELIIIDDGSKDSTWQKIKETETECKTRFSNIHFETKENEGTCLTLNRLINLTNGEYIFLIASDDTAKPELIEKEVKFLSENEDYSLVVFDNEFIDENGKRCYWNKQKETVYDIKKATADTFGHHLEKNRPFNFNSEEFGKYKNLQRTNHVPNGYMIRKSILSKTGLFIPEVPLEDHWLMLQISKYSKMKFIDEIQFSYRWHGKNTASKEEALEDITKLTRRYEKEFVKTIDLNTVLPEVKEFIERGKKYKTLGIPKIFEIRKYKNKNLNTKTTELLLFGKVVFSSREHK